MRERENSPQGRSHLPAFDPVGASIGVVVRPAATMTGIAAARPWQASLVLIVVYPVLNDLAYLVVPWAPIRSTTLPAGWNDLITNLAAFLHSPAWMIAVVIVSPLSHAGFTAIVAGFGRLLGGRGRFASLFSSLAYAYVPSLLSTPLDAWFRAQGVALGPVPRLGDDAFAIWVLILNVLAIRAALGLSIGRAIAACLIPLAIFGALGIATLVFFANRTAVAIPIG